ncbi:hypothetical protein [Clostridium felsineum]|uniref:Uncharacterized protein n=1 Tax=Clostridium felsineum TaxID=36839 RepID=A0A1S8L393_9CLOT|nr:hypothetical protein [Clostridium felsineum]URZ07551.1 hypothetical protein CLROS_028900 [Clostridium felsineum]URZ12582.1 hypothetical protein CROST_033050 [Clostridium felsineum]
MEEKNERLCKKCGNPIGIGMYSLISDLCDECYEREHYPDIHYNKQYIERDFYLSGGNYNIIDIVMFLKECEEQIIGKIKTIGVKNKQTFACAFWEYDKKEKLTELIQNKSTNLKCSYFFTNNKLELVPSFEDRNKDKNWIVCI